MSVPPVGQVSVPSVGQVFVKVDVLRTLLTADHAVHLLDATHADLARRRGASHGHPERPARAAEANDLSSCL